MRLGLAFGLALATAGTAFAVQVPEIEHRPPPCMDTEQFPWIEVQARGLKRLAVRFKADGDSNWYDTVLAPGPGGVFQGALPKPLPEAVRVTYFFVSTRPELRSAEFAVNVLMGGCPGARSAGELKDGLRVRRASDGHDEIPPGFNAEGVGRGGLSRTTLGILAGAAGGAGIAALAITDDALPPAPPMTENPQALRPCFTPDPIPDIDSGGSIVFDGTCTTPSTVTAYQWDFGDGSTGQGSSVEHLFRPGGTYSVTLTVSEGGRTDSTSRLVRVRATPIACFITSPDPPRIFVNGALDFNADCSVGDRDGGRTPITSYQWDFGDGDDSGEGRFVSHQYGAADLYGVTLTVTNQDGRQDRTTQFVLVERRGSGNRIDVTFTSEIELPAGTSAMVSLNDSVSVGAIAPSPQQHRLRAHSGENVVAARVLSDAGGEGRWRFDFSGAPNFVAGSLEVDSGEVLTLDGHRVVFRLTGRQGPPIRFRFRLEE
jgi:PKD repeat protein